MENLSDNFNGNIADRDDEGKPLLSPIILPQLFVPRERFDFTLSLSPPTCNTYTSSSLFSPWRI